MYVSSSKIQTLSSDLSVQSQCLHFIGKKNESKEDSNLKSNEQKVEKIIEMFCYFKPGITVKDFCLEYERDLLSLGIDER